MSIKTQARSGMRWTTVSMVITTVLSFVQLTFLARLLSPTDFGLMGMLTILLGLAQNFSDVGVSSAIIHYQEITEEQLSSLYWLSVGVSAFLYVLLLICSPLFVLLFHEPRIAAYLPLTGSTLIIGAMGAQFQILYQKELSFRLLAFQDVISSFLSVCIAVVMAEYGYGVWSLVWSGIVNGLARTLFIVIPGWRRWPHRIYFSNKNLRHFLNFGFFQLGERMVNYFNSRIDQILVGSLLGTQALGYYNIAVNLVLQPQQKISPIINKVAFPVFSKVQNDDDMLRRGYVKVIKLIATINAPLLLGFAAISAAAIPAFFGSKWVPAILLVQILSVFAMVRSTMNPIGSLQLAKGRADLGFYWNLGLLAVIGPAIYLGGRLGGLAGIALSLTIMQIVLLFFGYRFLVRPLIGKCAQAYFGAVFVPVFRAVLMAAAVVCIPLIIPGVRHVILIPIQVLVGGFVYVGILLATDMDTVHEFLAMLPLKRFGEAKPAVGK